MSILWELFISFFQIGLFTFGGGYAMIPMIRQTVEAKGWIDTTTLVDFIAVSESTPGPFAVNIATFIGMQQKGLTGAAVATLGVVLPSFLVILLVVRFFMTFSENRFVQGALSGLRPTVVGLILAAAYSIGYTTFAGAGTVDWRAVGIFAVVFALSKVRWKKKPHPVIWIALSAVLGIVLYGSIT